VETGQSYHKIKCNAATNTVAWNPKRHLLAFAGDDVDRNGRDEGSVRIFGFSSSK
jgi:THO complex subunit 3